MRISFELSDSDLEHFQKIMVRARQAAEGKDLKDIVDAASKLLAKVNQSETSDFIRDRMTALETLIGMVM